MAQNTNTQALSDAGVSIWLDDLSRERMDSGNLQELIDTRNVVGVTTNPTIFAGAIGAGVGYGDQIAEIAAGAPAGSGAAAVADLRRRVWSQPLPVGADPEAPEPGPTAGLAFGAYALGFVAEPVTWHVAGPWRRLSTPSGHVLTR